MCNLHFRGEMFLCVSDFTNALSNLEEYRTKLNSEYQKLKQLQEQKQIDLKRIDEMQYGRIKTSLQYEESINSKGEIVAVIKQRGNGSTTSMIEIINKYDTMRENTKASYESQITKSESKIKYYESYIKEIESVLNQLSKEIQKASIEIYCENQRYKDVADKLYMSSTSLYRKIQKEIDNVINK